MPAKRAPARAKPEDHGLTKAAACKILQVSPTADEELIAQAYWHLATKYRAFASRDPEARKHLDDLNRAYLVMNPGQPEAPLSAEVPPEKQDVPLAEEVVAWVRRVIEQTRARWPEHVPEVTTLFITTAILTYLALSANANPLWTLLIAAAAAITIWAPWRRA